MNKTFRTAFVIEQGKLHDMSALKFHAENIMYILKGDERDEEIAISISSEIIKINNKFFLGTDKFNEKLSQQNKEGVLNVKDKR